MSDAFRTHDGRTLEQAASDLVAREVLCCMSSVVSTLASGFAGDGSGSDLQNLSEQAYDLSAPVLDYEAAAREAGWTSATAGGTFAINRPATLEEIVEEDFEGTRTLANSWEDACELDNIEPHELEVFEHWAVSTWLAEKLEAAGERVDMDFAGLCVWARTTTGQAISMDSVIERITREMHAAR